MHGLADAIGGAIVTMAVVGFCIGVAAVIGGWVLWHYVLSHLTVGWA